VGGNILIYFIGIDVSVLSVKKTGGQRRYNEAFNCFAPDAVCISTFLGVLRIIFKKEAKFICFDERYLFLALPLLLFRRKVFFFPRGNKLIHFADSYSKVRLFLYKKIFTFLYLLCFKLVFQTKAQYLEFRTMYNFKGVYSVLPNHIRASWMSELFQLSAKNYVSGNILNVGFLGGISNRKGFSLAYEALLPFIQKNKVILRVAGGEIEDFSRFNAEAVGHVENLADFYRSCDVILIPSKYDSFPNVFLESIASSTIPLLTKDAITMDICGSNSPLLFVRDKESIQNIITHYLTNEDFRLTLKLECEKLRRKYDFDWSVAIKQIIEGDR
jgi:glycosyltransferase involved in cell wall biosynthesis